MLLMVVTPVASLTVPVTVMLVMPVFIIPVVIPKRLAREIDIAKQRPSLDSLPIPDRFERPEGVENVAVR